MSGKLCSPKRDETPTEREYKESRQKKEREEISRIRGKGAMNTAELFEDHRDAETGRVETRKNVNVREIQKDEMNKA